MKNFFRKKYDLSIFDEKKIYETYVFSKYLNDKAKQHFYLDYLKFKVNNVIDYNRNNGSIYANLEYENGENLNNFINEQANSKLLKILDNNFLSNNIFDIIFVTIGKAMAIIHYSGQMKNVNKFFNNLEFINEERYIEYNIHKIESQLKTKILQSKYSNNYFNYINEKLEYIKLLKNQLSFNKKKLNQSLPILHRDFRLHNIIVNCEDKTLSLIDPDFAKKDRPEIEITNLCLDIIQLDGFKLFEKIELVKLFLKSYQYTFEDFRDPLTEIFKKSYRNYDIDWENLFDYYIIYNLQSLFPLNSGKPKAEEEQLIQQRRERLRIALKLRTILQKRKFLSYENI